MEIKFSCTIAWHTPNQYVESVRELFDGEIDLDPATDEIAQLRIKAKKYYTKETNGLDKKWEGSVLLCPPYNEHLLRAFVDKALVEFKSGSVKQMVVLIHTKSTWEPWFQKLVSSSSAVCFLDHLIEWVAGHDIPNIATYDERGSVFFYFGKNVEKFKAIFSKHGGVMP